MSVVLVNDFDAAQSLKVRAPDWKGEGERRRYDFSANDRPVDADGFPVPKQTLLAAVLTSDLVLDLPPRSFVLLTTLPE